MNCLRLLPFALADGPHNMAADEVLLRTALTGVASLRFYGWSVPTVSLGYFQTAQARLEQANLAALPFVRRPSGGGMLVHHHELTYALALPPGAGWHGQSPWLVRMHQILAAALGELGVVTQSFEGRSTAPAKTGLCFQQFAAGDLRIGSAKIAGSAQRRHRGVLLQHGALLLARSIHAPTLPGIAELCGMSLTRDAVIEAIQCAFTEATGWSMAPAVWTDAERVALDELVRTKYSQDSWNCRR